MDYRKIYNAEKASISPMFIQFYSGSYRTSDHASCLCVTLLLIKIMATQNYFSKLLQYFLPYLLLRAGCQNISGCLHNTVSLPKGIWSNKIIHVGTFALLWV